MSVDLVLPLLIALPLLGAALSLISLRNVFVQRSLGVTVLGAQFALAVVALLEVKDGSVASANIGGWSPDVGIVLAVDPLAAVLLVVSCLMLSTVYVYALGSGHVPEGGSVFHPVYLTLAAGIAASFATADLFNLFVAFEIMLSSSYVLLTLGGRPEQVRHGMTYVVISLLASVLFLTAVGLLYAATGTVNLAELARVVPELHPGLRTALGLLLLVVFGIKAAIFPLFQWLPDSYPTAPSPVTALFAGLLTKVGVYAIIRTQTLLFPVDAGSSGLLLVVAGLTMTVGVLGAISQGEMKRILSFHIISQIGYMIMGLGLFTVAGVAGAVFYVVHHIIVKTSLFLVAGLVEHRYGTGRLRDVAGVMTTAPVVALLFAVPALSLAGIPPFSGFLAKLSLAQAGFADQQMVIVGISFLVGLLTLFSMTKIWTAVFWGEPREPAEEMSATGPAERRSLSLAATTATAVLVAASIGVAVAAEPLFTVSERAAAILLEPGPYLEAVGE